MFCIWIRRKNSATILSVDGLAIVPVNKTTWYQLLLSYLIFAIYDISDQEIAVPFLVGSFKRNFSSYKERIAACTLALVVSIRFFIWHYLNRTTFTCFNQNTCKVITICHRSSIPICNPSNNIIWFYHIRNRFNNRSFTSS